MLWIKRNLFLVAGSLVALLLLAFGVYYLFSSVSKNKEMEAALDEKVDSLNKLYGQDPFPSSANIAKMKEEQKKVKAAVSQMRQYVVPIPVDKVTGIAFRTLLEKTIFDLQKKADLLSIKLPATNYTFSFLAQMKLVTFAPGSFPALPEQLAEIKVISDILFDAKVNKLINLRRARVSADDPPGSTDYHDYKGGKNPVVGTVSSIYEVSFQCFSPELAAVLDGFHKTPHGLIVKTVSVDGYQPPEPANPNQPQLVIPVQPPPRSTKAGASAPATKLREEAKTVLNERLIKAVLLIELIKPAPPAK